MRGTRQHLRAPAVVCAVLMIVFSGVATLWAAGTLRVSTLTRSGQVLISVELAGAFTESVRSAIQSGLQTTFKYDVRLTEDSLFWPDRTVASATLAATVRYDNLTDQYSIARMVDGRVEETTQAHAVGEVQTLLTRFDQVPLFSTATLEPNSEYRVRVRASRRPHDGWFALPWIGGGTTHETRFTFLP